MKAITLYIGLDVHKDSIVIAIAEPGRNGEIRIFGTITNDLQALEKAMNRIRKAHPDAILEIAYEAGPCGFGIARRLKQLKVSCLVAAPSLIPEQPGSPFKTDKRDARGLARLLRAGELTGVCIPEPTDEAIRDLCRARTDAVDDHRRCRHRLKGFLHGTARRLMVSIDTLINSAASLNEAHFVMFFISYSMAKSQRRCCIQRRS